VKYNWLGVISTLVLSSVASAQGNSMPKPAPPQTTTVSSGEIIAAVERSDTGAFSDSVLRVVPIQSEYNVGVSAVRRSHVDGRTPPDAVVHDAITEVYQIIEGKGVLVTGGTLASATHLPSDGLIVRESIGPSSVGKHILGGTRQRVGPGDIIVIPPHTAHGFVEINTERIVYTVIRIDAQRLLELHSGFAPVLFTEGTEKARVFITDSKSWEASGGFAGNASGFAGYSSGGARPQTAEIVKNFRERCPNYIVTVERENADYFVILEHEGGKGLVRKDNKFAIFNQEGDAIASGSTRFLGSAVKDACTAIKKELDSQQFKTPQNENTVEEKVN
jgi:AraC-like ligand binding domain